MDCERYRVVDIEFVDGEIQAVLEPLESGVYHSYNIHIDVLKKFKAQLDVEIPKKEREIRMATNYLYQQADVW